ncbi:MAG: DUF934 domain-containing protein [Gallionellaceae bacterium]
MSKVIKNGQVVSNEWKLLHAMEGVSPQNVKLPVGPLLVPLAVWKARRAELIHREYEHGWALGVWLTAEDSPEFIKDDLDDFTVIAVEFNKFTDGNSYMTARLLRERYGYKGELRAIGDVPQEKLSFLHQLGFDAVVVRISRQISSRISGLFHSDRAAEASLAAA